jgi:hypothetical protein
MVPLRSRPSPGTTPTHESPPCTIKSPPPLYHTPPRTDVAKTLLFLESHRPTVSPVPPECAALRRLLGFPRLGAPLRFMRPLLRTHRVIALASPLISIPSVPPPPSLHPTSSALDTTVHLSSAALNVTNPFGGLGVVAEMSHGPSLSAFVFSVLEATTRASVNLGTPALPFCNSIPRFCGHSHLFLARLPPPDGANVKVVLPRRPCFPRLDASSAVHEATSPIPLGPGQASTGRRTDPADPRRCFLPHEAPPSPTRLSTALMFSVAGASFAAPPPASAVLPFPPLLCSFSGPTPASASANPRSLDVAFSPLSTLWSVFTVRYTLPLMPRTSSCLPC